MVQEEYVFEDNNQQPKKAGLGKFIWNSENREFLGRDGASWGKITLFYAIFYTCLGSFFVGLLAIFIRFMPTDRPTYVGEQSTMSTRGLNPGLGFRPQIDVEDHVISFNPKNAQNPTNGYTRYVRNLKNFLDAKYGQELDQSSVVKCASNSTESQDDLENGKACEFDYKTEFATTDCDESKSFGYDTNKPCVLVKLNKIYTWKPEGGSVIIRCEGETSADRDNLRGVIYHSVGDLNNKVEGTLDRKFFPYMGQKSYRAPFVWAQFDIPANVLVNIECKAYAKNIDNKDRLNRRGQTKFSIQITNRN